MKPFALLLPLLCVLAAVPAAAQAPPGTDIWLIAWQDLRAAPENARNLTDRDGYDNQPFFTPDGTRLLYTSGRGEQTDVYRLDPATGVSEQVTDTPESEYSPTPLPTGEGFSVVRVEADGRQRLWRFTPDGRDPALLLEAVQPVGYHAWADAYTVALFVLGEPPTLQQADVRSGQADTLARNVGRSLHRVPGTSRVSFVHKTEEDGPWIVKTLDPATGAVTAVVETLPGREDYAWRPDGTLLMADGAVLFQWTPQSDAWHPLADFTAAGLTNITRLAVSPDGALVALVADRP